MIIKIVSAIIGFRMANIPGLIVGLILGHLLDQRLKEGLEGGSFVDLVRDTTFSDSDRRFFEACFSMFAKLAKADGPIVRSEIAAVEHVMKTILALGRISRKRAIQIFKAAKDDHSSFYFHADNFQKQYHDKKAILRAMVETLFTIAIADGPLNKAEEKLIIYASDTFGFSEAEYLSIKGRYIKTTSSVHESELKHNPYDILECNPSDSNDVVKKKYRSLVQQYHPDKLASKDLPKGFDKMATEKFRQIQEAFSEIKEMRGMD